MTAINDRKMARLKFRRQFRFELIDGSERAIERQKSMIRNYKAQIKEINAEINAMIDGEKTSCIVH
jgi:hypothetical protein